MAIKSQILADLVADFTPTLISEVEKELLLSSGTSSGVWTLFTGGALNVKGSGLGIVLKPPMGSTNRQSIKTSRLTNNEAEYEAMIAGLELDKSLGAEVIKAKCDSLLVVNQEWTLDHVAREQNSEADALANLGFSVEEDDIVSGTVVQLSRYVVEEGHAKKNSTSLTWDWRNKYIDYLKDGKLPSDHKESRALRTKAARFALDKGGTLYKRTFDRPLAVYFGPGTPIMFYKRSMKWVEAQAFEKIRKIEVINFIWDHIICRFGIPAEIVGNNGKQFIGSKVTEFLEALKIKRILSKPYHPTRNGQAKSTNKTIIQNLKKRLDDAKGKWREVLPEVLWAYRTTSKSSTGATPFSLVYGS
ncbi:uncharacterized protein [Nicotiana sylvestris]|uniref:uncharacterized protein n=1 Tax=Nicotiana sylvestris TaxID=4096 RepID=UPI00388C9F84